MRRPVRSVDEVKLAWPNRRWREGEHAASVPAPSLRVVETTSGHGTDPVRLLHADAAELAASLAVAQERADLVYVDPPYASERDYVSEARLDGPADGRVVRTRAYEDRWAARDGGVGAYLEMLAPRLEALASVLSPRGTFWVHLDWRASYLVRVLLDEIFGRDAFMNEIVWRRAPNLGRQATSAQFGRTLDTILVYGRPEARLEPPTRLEPIDEGSVRVDDEGRPFTTAPRGDYTDASVARLEAEGRIHRTASGRVYVKYFLVPDADGVLCRERRVDALWTDIAPLRHARGQERTGYPTQKPEALLERIIRCATRPGDLVVDGFSGSGTTATVAHRLGRRAVASDESAVAIAVARARLLRSGAPLRIERSATRPAPAELPVRLSRGVEGVRLEEPTEPLAWAVGRERDGVFDAAWHAERLPGPKPVAAKRDARVDPAGPLAVRVYGDDGRVGRAEVPR